MSTEFRTTDTDEWVCTRWGRNPAMGVDFGSVERFNRIVSLCLTNQVEFVGEDGTTVTSDDIVRLVTEGTFPVHCCRRTRAVPTFGEFVGTIELGSGEYFDRTGQ